MIYPPLLLILMCINVQMLLIFINTINVLTVLIATWCYMFTKLIFILNPTFSSISMFNGINSTDNDFNGVQDRWQWP